MLKRYINGNVALAIAFILADAIMESEVTSDCG